MRSYPYTARPARLAIAATALVVAATTSACGTPQDPTQTLETQEQIRLARQEGARTARAEERLRQIERKLAEKRDRSDERGGGGPPVVVVPDAGSPAGGPATAPDKDCGGGISASSKTSCQFARNVRAAYYDAGGAGELTVTAYSPRMGRNYTMACSDSGAHVCQGGDQAAVYF